MKRLFLLTVCLTMFLFLFGGVASATPVTFTETYMQAPRTEYFRLYEGYSVAFDFNLAQVGGLASLYNEKGDLLGTRNPTIDETGYDPSAYETPVSAKLTFKIWDWTPDLTLENLKIKAGILDGDRLLADETFSIFLLNREKTVTIDLGQHGLLDYLADGSFLTVAFGAEWPGCWENDFNISEATLVAEANHSVPEPGTMMLMGFGLAGIAALSRRRIRK